MNTEAWLSSMLHEPQQAYIKQKPQRSSIQQVRISEQERIRKRIRKNLDQFSVFAKRVEPQRSRKTKWGTAMRCQQCRFSSKVQPKVPIPLRSTIEKAQVVDLAERQQGLQLWALELQPLNCWGASSSKLCAPKHPSIGWGAQTSELIGPWV